MTGVTAKIYEPGTRQWLQQAVHISLFTDARLPNGQTPPDNSTDVRGHWADMFISELQQESLGSLLWTLRREKLTQDVINRARDICYNALLWLLDTTYVTALAVLTERRNNDTMAILITLTLPGGRRFEVEEIFNAV